MLKVVKGLTSYFWWWVQHEPNIEVLWKPSFARLSELCYASPFEDTKNVVAYLPSIPSDLSSLPLPEETNLYILQPSTGRKAKLGKLKVEEFTPPTPDLSLELSVSAQLVEKFNNPFRLLWHIKSGSEEPVTATETEVVNTLLESFKENSAPLIWGKIAPRYQYSLLLTPDQEASGMYKILAGNGVKTGFCAGLWFYWNYFFDHTNEFHLLPNERLKLFASWVVLASTTYKTNVFRGMYAWKSKTDKEFFSFEPSPAAIEALDACLFNL